MCAIDWWRNYRYRFRFACGQAHLQQAKKTAESWTGWLGEWRWKRGSNSCRCTLIVSETSPGLALIDSRAERGVANAARRHWQLRVGTRLSSPRVIARTRLVMLLPNAYARCKGSVYRTLRRLVDLLMSIFIPIRRYRCHLTSCSWEGKEIGAKIQGFPRSFMNTFPPKNHCTYAWEWLSIFCNAPRLECWSSLSIMAILSMPKNKGNPKNVHQRQYIDRLFRFFLWKPMGCYGSR